MKPNIIISGFTVLLLLGACQTTSTKSQNHPPRIMMTLEEGCNNDEFILVKDKFRNESSYQSSSSIGMPVMEDYACKYNSKMRETYIDKNRRAQKRVVTSQDGKVYTRAQLESLANNNANIEIGRVIRRKEMTVAPY